MLNKITPRRYTGLRNQFDDFYDLMDQFFNEGTLPTKFNNEPLFKVDIQDLEDEYLVEADLPGYDKKEINIKLDDGRLTISVNKDEEIDKSDEKKNYIHKERKTSSMSRSMYFDNIDEENLKAKLDNGVLEIKIPKRKNNNKTKEIEID
ncbi:Hsp20/alpha crystallin family protein [Miniphocaeibacter halophilus]|uniref:Hsp20/alpha crystallin family protein n=1 Tax=Miniphocaeibacter halophilus TaxID=2931922 RepID=A0AC61MS69_9FIRM|nr:Hsp20/alpha crystallin family protein [Miniphocaeibacter halophilus]QQK07261.1 Hsp20/alpha crystallin family protein [Miniphocaeibacter halophilus]